MATIREVLTPADFSANDFDCGTGRLIIRPWTFTDGVNSFTVQPNDTITFSSGSSGLTVDLSTDDEVEYSLCTDDYANDAAAIVGGLTAGDLYFNTTTGCFKAVDEGLTFGFDITDGVTTEGIVNGDTITYATGSDGLAVAVSATDTVTYSLCTDTYVDDAAAVVGGLSAGDLYFNSTDGCFKVVDPAAAAVAIDITDGVTTETVNNGETITFDGGDGLTAVVSATDTVTYNLCTTSYANEAAAVVGGESPGDVYFDTALGCLRVVSPTAGSFDITDGVTTETVNDGDTITYASGSSGLAVAVSATDTVTYSLCTDEYADNAAAIAGGLAVGDLYFDTGVGCFTVVDFAAGSFDITDGVTTETVDNGNTITFVGGDGLTAVVSATDTVTYNLCTDSYANDAAAIVGGLTAGEVYFNSTLGCLDSVAYTIGQLTNVNITADTATDCDFLVFDDTSGLWIPWEPSDAVLDCTGLVP